MNLPFQGGKTSSDENINFNQFQSCKCIPQCIFQSYVWHSYVNAPCFGIESQRADWGLKNEVEDDRLHDHYSRWLSSTATREDGK